MCGIAGKFFFERSLFQDSDLDDMLQAIYHRGPDSSGRYDDGRVLLGFRRLSIIDTMSGDQPLFSEDGDIALIANGEIYNYLELKSLLIGKGHHFKTGSDCEVLVHLYEEFGPLFVKRLNGMFAFCLYDRRKEKLLLGRDRIGIKPLYIAKREGVLVFASEIKAILRSNEIDSIEAQDVLAEYLCFRSLSGARTFFSGIDLLLPGTIMEATPDSLRVTQYWQPAYNHATISQADAVRLIQDTLRRSVSRQLMSDVPLGTQLSGGVDSSWVSCLAALEKPGMKSFSVGFSEERFDETAEARLVAARAKLEYHQVTSNPAFFAEILPKIIWHNDEPLTHANSVEIYNLCRYAKEHVKVLLTGEGADELFGGYPRYYLTRLGGYHDRLPSIFRPIFRYGLDWLSRGRGKKPSFYLGMKPLDLVFWNPAFTSPAKVAWLMDSDELNFSFRRELLSQSWRDDLTPLDNLLLYELHTYLQPILQRQDKMSMGASIEARVPILDNELIDLALKFSAAEKMKIFRPKYLFKLAAEKDLPTQIVHKRKIGFSVPVGKWMNREGPLTKFLDHLNDSRCNLSEVNPIKLEKIIQEHREGIVDHQDVLWPLVNYIIWQDIFFDRDMRQ